MRRLRGPILRRLNAPASPTPSRLRYVALAAAAFSATAIYVVKRAYEHPQFEEYYREKWQQAHERAERTRRQWDELFHFVFPSDLQSRASESYNSLKSEIKQRAPDIEDLSAPNPVKTALEYIVKAFGGAKDAYFGLKEALSTAGHTVKRFYEKGMKPEYRQEVDDMLLPPPLPEPHSKPLTVLVDMRLFFSPYPGPTVRSGLDYFLAQASVFSEIVLVHNDSIQSVMELVDDIDGTGGISYMLGHQHWHVNSRDAGRMSMKMRGNPPRDLRRLNRDLGRVVVLAYAEDGEWPYPRHPENLLRLRQSVKTWLRNPHDTDLFDIVPVLLHLSQVAQSGGDVRDEIQIYREIDPCVVARASMKQIIADAFEPSAQIEESLPDTPLTAQGD